MIDYRDYGALNGDVASRTPINTVSHTQVYTVTHDGAGKRLPLMNRSFISFSYGGKLIEDFGFIVIIENNQMERNVYADFSDNITESDVFDGQIYWSSHYNTNTLDLTLFTDGVTERQLDEFKRWFIPGPGKELILSEHPNRAILARIAEPPVYNMLPFEQKTVVKVANQDISTSTTLYKGRIDLSFVMDDPFWYSLVNILDYEKSDGSYDSGKWIDANGESSLILEDKDAAKIILEDGIPVAEMTQDSSSQIAADAILLGVDKVVAVDMSLESTGSRIGKNEEGASIDLGHIAFVITTNNIGMTILPGEENYASFYYAGTAPCKPRITFTITPSVNNDGYISSPWNSYVPNGQKTYQTITIESIDKHEFSFTTPSMWTGYNQAIWILNNIGNNVSWEEVRQAIRDNVKHFAPRAYAIAAIDASTNNTTVTSSETLANAITYMKKFLLDENNNIMSANFTYDCKTGQTLGLLHYRTNNESFEILAEDVGDMVKSDYLIITDRNYPDNNGYITKWTKEHPTTCHRIYHDIENGLTHFILEYKYMYL